MYEILAMVGILLIFAGIVSIFSYVFFNAYPKNAQKNANVSAAGLIMIGPIPIAFGTSSSMVVVAEILGIVILIIMIIFFFLARR
ncbi:MAG: TIGR00304 family membrane protein [Candidatus Micrarchaeia archaeon]